PGPLDRAIDAGGSVPGPCGQRQGGGGGAMNGQAVKAIYKREMLRTWRTVYQSVASPVVSTALYFVVFGAAIGSRIQEVEGISYGAFIVPGLMMLTLLQQSLSNGSSGIYMPKWICT